MPRDFIISGSLTSSRMERGFSPDTIRLLQERGHEVEVIPAVARIAAIVSDGGWLQGRRTDAATARLQDTKRKQTNESRSYPRTCSLITG